MKTKFQIKSLVLGVLLGAAAVIGIAADKESPGPTVWEYSAETIDLHAVQPGSHDWWWAKELTRRSAQGWEIVCTRRVSDSDVEIVAKRPKNEHATPSSDRNSDQ